MRNIESTIRQRRHSFKQLALVAAVGGTLLLTGCGDGNGSDTNGGLQLGLSEARSVALLDKKAWAFVQDDTLTDDAALAQNGTGWLNVTLPHTWNARDAASVAQTTPTSTSYKRGLGWYRLEFDNPANGASQWLQFDGASIVADVWLNGTKLGEHKGAFTRFRFDVTSQLKPGKNVLLVKADNSAPTAGGATAILPLSGDFNMSGGLYRSVSLVSTPANAYFALDDFGGSGVYATSSGVTANSASIAIKSKLVNSGKADATFVLRAGLTDATGKVVKSVSSNVAIKAGQHSEFSQALAIENPHLWNGLTDPYLYKVVVQLEDLTGAVVDRVIQDYGVRDFKFDPVNGFFLNGKSYPLRGVNMHQDYQDMAWGITKTQTDKSFELIKEIGANTVRLAHYPHASYTLEQADKMGLVVWAENAFVNQTVVPCNASSTTSAEFVENGKTQLRELIRQQFNHASIATWSVGNETTQGCGLPANAVPVLTEFNKLAKEEDPSRVTTLAANKDEASVGGITDVWARNEYPMWYQNYLPAALGVILDGFRTTFAKQPIGISEYGAGAAVTHQSDNATDGIGFVPVFDFTGKTRTMYQPESYASSVHELDYAMIESKPYLWGTYVWNMFDFGSDIRHEGDIGGTNTKGLVSFDRNTKKDAFYFYKAHWSTDVVTYITSRRYVNRNLPTANVKVYSNADSTSLSVNGVNVKTMAAAECGNKTCNFGEVRLAEGSNAVVATGTRGGTTATDSVAWTLDADHAKNIYLAAGQMTTGFVSEAGSPLGVVKTFGSDNYFTGGVRKKISNAQFTAVIGNTGTTTVPAEGRVWDAFREEANAGAGFSYNLSLVPGKTYLVTLGFLESTANAVGARVFDVQATTGGATSTPLANVDVYAQAGAMATAVARQFPVTIGSDGKLNLSFTGRTGKAMLSNMMLVQQ
ncbi:MAG: glycoside hydrolase family 2 TIM barrel-domain containing protein [Rhodoferax sp.]|uniref:glycoside hydrolase family 2 TIM barrel-domain containing protein n=1 Tax=Rhodoferax sp. TaxID=50421 RepID=UPI0032651444